ncbi:MAG: hypothetical protein ACKOGA_17715, partial [Planctomycetaceae bacterium]
MGVAEGLRGWASAQAAQAGQSSARGAGVGLPGLGGEAMIRGVGSGLWARIPALGRPARWAGFLSSVKPGETSMSADRAAMSRSQTQPGGSLIQFKLFLMMVLQFFIWGAWLPLIFAYLPGLKFESWQQSL